MQNVVDGLLHADHHQTQYHNQNITNTISIWPPCFETKSKLHLRKKMYNLFSTAGDDNDDEDLEAQDDGSASDQLI